MTRAADEVGAVLRARYLASESHDLDAAVAETLATISTDRLDREGLDRLESALVRALQDLRGRSAHDPFDLALTPVELARAAGALVALVDKASLTRVAAVLDPACGTGRLLGAGTAGLAPGAKRIGWDVDPAALALARSLASARARMGGAGDIEMFECDGLAAPRPPVPAGALAVLCRPPDVNLRTRWSRASRAGVGTDRDVSRAWGEAAGSMAVAFVTRMVRDVLRPGEVGVFILPEAPLDAPRHASFRSALLAHVDQVVVGRAVVGDAGSRGLRLVGVRRARESVFETSPRPTEVRFAEWDDEWTMVGAHDAGRETPDGAPTLAWPTPHTEAVWRLVDKGSRLGAVISAHDGIRIGRREDHRRMVSRKPRGIERPRPLISAADVDAGHLQPASSWLDFRPESVPREAREAGTSLRDAALFRGPRLYVAQHEHGVSCVAVDDDSVARSPVYVLRWRGRGDALGPLRALSAILSTDAVADVAEALFSRRWSAQRGLQLREIESLPLPWPPPDALLEASERWAAAPGEGRLRHVDTLLRRWLELDEA